jgi:hypothetical protein
MFVAMKKIFKYSTLVDGDFKKSFSIQMPKGSQILSVQIDQKTSHPTIWAMVDPEKPEEERFFELFGTGQDIYEDMGIERVYIGTYQYQKGEFVGHIFERIN